MIRYLLLLCFSFLAANILKAQMSGCAPSQFILTNYTNDAKRLALYEIYKNQDSYIDSIEIPFSYAYPILEDLQAIQDVATPHPADTLFTPGTIHCLGPLNTEGLSLQLDTNFMWVKQWMQGNQITGNAAIDSLMTTYGLTMSNYYNYPWGDSYVSISASRPLNMYAVCYAFDIVSGVLGPICNVQVGTGRGIIRNDSVGFTEYIFEAGWGDCESGCIYRVNWTFHVYPGCVAQYVSRWSNYHDSNTGILQFQISNPKFQIYPNPASTAVNIVVDEGLIGSTVTVTDIMGKEIISSAVSIPNSKFEIQNLPNGIYFVTIRKDGAVLSQKLVVQR